MRRNKQERKYKDVITADIINFLSTEVDYADDKQCEKLQDYRDELEQREPFREFKRKIDQQEKRIEQLSDGIKKLLSHKHDNDGNVNIPIKEALKEVYY